MVDVRGDVLRPPHGTTPAAVKANKIQKLSSFKSNENIHKREDGSYYVVSANKAVLRDPNLALSFHHGSKHTVVRSADNWVSI